MNQMNILLVDDEPEILKALKLRLGKNYNIHTTTNPREGLTLLKQNGPFPIVVSDFRMPDMNGIDFLVEVNKICPQTSSILLTGQGEYNTAIEALNTGKIFKYLSKPCHTVEINEALSEGISKFKKEMNKKDSLKEYDKENRVAKIVQDQMLFSPFKPLNTLVDLTALSVPKKRIGGDFYEIIPHDPYCFDLVIADVMGKGLPAALIGAAVKNSLMHQVQILKAAGQLRPSISDIMLGLESDIHASLQEAGMFITLLYARLDLKAMTISYVSNGHPRGLIIRDKSPETTYMQSTHMPLGIHRRGFFEAVHLRLKPSDKIIFYTDGISEALVQDPSDDPLELIVDCLDGQEESTAEINQKIFNKAKSTRGIEDDMTVISMNLNNNLPGGEFYADYSTEKVG